MSKEYLLKKYRHLMPASLEKDESILSTLTPEEIAAMIKASEPNRRDNMLIKIMYFLGLTNSEVQHLQITDIDLENLRVIVRRGEKKRARTVTIPSGFINDLRVWVGDRQGGPLFTGRSMGLLSDRHIRRIIKTHACAANVRNPTQIHPHSLCQAHREHLR